MILKFQMKEEVIHSYLLAVCQQQVKYYSLRQRDYQINYLVVTEVCQWDSFKYTTWQVSRLKKLSISLSH